MNSIIGRAAAFALLAILAIAGSNQALACGGNQCGTGGGTPAPTSDFIVGGSARFVANANGNADGAFRGHPNGTGTFDAYSRGETLARVTGEGTYNGPACGNCGNATFRLQGNFVGEQATGSRTTFTQAGPGNGGGALRNGAHANVDGGGAFRLQSNAPR